MPTLAEVKKMVKDLGIEADQFGTKKEIKYLPQILKENEKIYALTSGKMDGKTWLITCTNTRVIFLDKGMIYGLKQVDTPLEKINSIEHKTGLFFGEISIWDGSSSTTIKSISKATVKPFVNKINDAIQALKQVTAAPQKTEDDLIAQLEKLAALVDKGVLTQEEFQAKKKKMLDLV